MTTNAGSEAQLAALHKRLAETMLRSLDSSDRALYLLGQYPDLPDEVRDFLNKACDINPALMQAITKFLKDNDINCPVDESAELSAIERKVKAKRTIGNVTHIDDEA